MSALNQLGVVLLGLGGLLLLWTLRALVQRRALLRTPVKVDGLVIRVRSVASSSDHSAPLTPSKFYPTVRYETNEGKTIDRELPPTRESSECRVGAVIRLVYQRGNPANVVYADLRWGDLVSTLIGSLIVLGIGALLCFCVEGTRKKPANGATSTLGSGAGERPGGTQDEGPRGEMRSEAAGRHLHRRT